MPFQNCVSLPSGPAHLRFRFKDGRVPSAELASGRRQRVPEGPPLVLVVLPCCAQHLLWGHRQRARLHCGCCRVAPKPSLCCLHPLHSLGPAQRSLCAALAELGTGGCCKGGSRCDCLSGGAASLVGKAQFMSAEEGGASVAGVVPAGA